MRRKTRLRIEALERQARISARERRYRNVIGKPVIGWNVIRLHDRALYAPFHSAVHGTLTSIGEEGFAITSMGGEVVWIVEHIQPYDEVIKEGTQDA